MRFKQYIKENTSLISEAMSKEDIAEEIADYKKANEVAQDDIDKLERKYKMAQKKQDFADSPDDPVYDKQQDIMDDLEQEIDSYEMMMSSNNDEIADLQKQAKDLDKEADKSDDSDSDSEGGEDLDKEAEKYADDTEKFIDKMEAKFKDDDKTLEFLKGLTKFVKDNGYLTGAQRKSLSNLNQK